MRLIPQASAAALLLVLTLCLQCAGVAALVEWLQGVTAKGAQGFGPVRSGVLVVKSTIAIIILHGLVILLWASFYRLQCFSFVGTRFLLLLEQLRHRRLRRRDPSQQVEALRAS
jgi:hypothetical protein